ncbi:hypothetical protein EDD17DRAFT_1673156 [Pisolithus thermaeus]|nr:hypothetical protein EDD17DRAFT_1673156 [Pisolithus thermaeus]
MMTVLKKILTIEHKNTPSCLGDRGERCDQQTTARSRRDAPENDQTADVPDPDPNFTPSNEVSPGVLSSLDPSCTTGSEVNAATPHAISALAWLPPLKLLNFTDVPGRPLLHVPEIPERLNNTCIPQPAAQTYVEGGRTPTEIIVAAIVLGCVVLLATTIKIIQQRRRKKGSVASPGTFERSTTIESGVLDSSPVFGGRDRYTFSLRSSNSHLLAWEQYQSKLSKPEPTATVTRRTLGDVEASAEIKHAPCSQGVVEHRSPLKLCANYPLTGVGNVTSTRDGNATPLQPPRSVTTDAVSRLSGITSLYPNSSNCSRIGLAISTFDSEQPKEGATSMQDADLPAATMALVTDATSDLSPVATNLKRDGVGRARIKAAYYTPGAHPPAPTGLRRMTNVIRGDGSCMMNWEPRHPSDKDVGRASRWLDMWRNERKLAHAMGGPQPRQSLRSTEEKAV